MLVDSFFFIYKYTTYFICNELSLNLVCKITSNFNNFVLQHQMTF